MKEHNSKIRIYGVEPAGCDYLNNTTIPHKIEAISIGGRSPFIPSGLLSGMISVVYKEVIEFISLLAKTQGLFVGISSGANILAALKCSIKYDNSVNIVTVAPDSGRSYLEHFNQ